MSRRVNRSGYELEFEERFDSTRLDPNRWVPHYLPQWTTPDRSMARFDLTGDALQLRIDSDQPAWREGDGELRVSNVQTGTYSGPLGSRRGQHRHRTDLAVVTPQPTRRLYTPSGGLVEARLRAVADPTIMLAFWLIGFEDESADDSGEICVVELFGDSIGTVESELSLGVKAHDDPRLHDDMDRVRLTLDATDWHRYAAAWDNDEIRLYVDGELIRAVRQSITYRMQLMLDLFEFPESTNRDPHAYPKVGEVSSVLGYRLAVPEHERR